MSHNILNIFYCPLIYDEIFFCLDFPDLARTSRTCRAAKHAVSEFCRREYNINKHLSYFFNDSIAFRNLQARTGALVSGSNVLQFLDRIDYEGTKYNGSDLDIFVQDIHTRETGHWILAEGYEFVPAWRHGHRLGKRDPTFDEVEESNRIPNTADSDIQAKFIEVDPDYPLTALSNVFTFYKNNRQVQVISTRCTPLQCILLFHCTCVMNYFTHEAAYSLYARATFDARVALAVKEIGHREIDALLKYRWRGWKIFECDRGLKKVSTLYKLFRVDRERRTGDELTWKLPFGTDDIDPQYRNVYNPALDSSWSIKRHDGSRRDMEVNCGFFVSVDIPVERK
ncbi:hypothetical protein BDQ17DRAFT_1420613 [Cyathus striatus]|nr:hypothetical protein BDQ17DRAFT_1420613 [Cyathus striatus]